MLVLAHRGASKVAPENTLKAFRMGFDMGAHGLEFDTYQIGDEIVVFHDRWLSRTSNGTGRVADQSLTYLRCLDAGEGEQIPLLSEALQCVPAWALCNVEIKGMTNPDNWLSGFLSACSAADLQPDAILISSFNHHWLHALKTRRPTLRIGALTASINIDGFSFASALDTWSVHIALDIIEEWQVREAHAAGYQVFVYTVDNPEDILLLKAWGVNGIFTNKPDVALATLKHP